jgi:hypothetical protein
VSGAGILDSPDPLGLGVAEIDGYRPGKGGVSELNDRYTRAPA